jgi:HEAT repeat protein
MEPFLGLVGISLVGSVAYLTMWWRFQERSRAWQAAATAAGLTNLQTHTFFGWNSKLTGQAGNLQVILESYHRGKHESGTRMIVGGLRHGIYALTIRPEGMGSLVEKTFGEKELEVGDEAFDREAYVQGSPALVRALFDKETRSALQDLLRGRLLVKTHPGVHELDVRSRIIDNQLIVDIRERPFSGTLQWLPEALRNLVALGQRLARPEDVGAKIAVNSIDDPVPAVRLANLQTLTREFPEHPATRPALLKALEDPSPEVRLRAAIAAGPDGRETLLGLALREDCPDEIAARAVTSAGHDLPLDRLLHRLKQASDEGSSRVALACIEVAGSTAQPEAIEALAGILAGGNEELAGAAARNIGILGSESAEIHLIAALDHASAEVRIAASDALAKCGSPRAVLPLRRCAGAHPLDISLRRSARQAIAEIQARLTGASPGQLSLSVDESGQVSLVDEDRRGRLTLDQ